MIKNIVFDMGNVLTRYNAREYIYGYVHNEEDFRWIKNHLCASVEWLKMDRGTMTDEDAAASICKKMPEHLHATVKRFIEEYRMIQPPNHPMERLVEELGPKWIWPVSDVQHFTSFSGIQPKYQVDSVYEGHLDILRTRAAQTRAAGVS